MSGLLRISFEIFCKKYLERVCLKNHYELKIKGSDYIIDIWQWGFSIYIYNLIP